MNKQHTIERIAREILDLETLRTRKSDRLDFSEQAVWSIARALEAAFEAGRASGRKKSPAAFRVGQHVRVTPLGETGRIAGIENDLLIVDLDAGGTVHVPAADCDARSKPR